MGCRFPWRDLLVLSWNTTNENPSTHKSPEHQFGHRGSTPLETYLSQEEGRLHRHGAPVSGIQQLNLRMFLSLKAILSLSATCKNPSWTSTLLPCFSRTTIQFSFRPSPTYLWWSLLPSFPKLKSLSDNFTFTLFPPQTFAPLPPITKSEKRAKYSQSLFMWVRKCQK